MFFIVEKLLVKLVQIPGKRDNDKTDRNIWLIESDFIVQIPSYKK